MDKLLLRANGRVGLIRYYNLHRNDGLILERKTYDEILDYIFNNFQDDDWYEEGISSNFYKGCTVSELKNKERALTTYVDPNDFSSKVIEVSIYARDLANFIAKELQKASSDDGDFVPEVAVDGDGKFYTGVLRQRKRSESEGESYKITIEKL